MNRVKILLLAACGAAAVLAVRCTLQNRGDDFPKDTLPAIVEGSLVKPKSQDGAPPPSPPEVVKPLRPKSMAEPTLGQGMVDPNPLAFVTQQHSLAKPGSFAVAEQVTYQCREANQLVAKSRPERAIQRATSLGKDTAAFQARFIEAQQSIQSRCNDFRQEVATDNPLKNDAFAAEFADAQSKIFRPDENYAANLIKLANQGQLASAYIMLATVPKFQGETFRSDEDKAIFQDAVRLAAFNATSVEGSREKDLRTLSGCLATGFCDGTYDAFALSRWAEGTPQREKALALSKRMEAVFRANDVRGWIQKP